MKSVIILIAGTNVKLSPDHMGQIIPVLQQKNIDVSCAKILKEEKAVSIPFNKDLDLIALQNELMNILEKHQIDVAVLPDEKRQKRLLIADMDSTMIHQECIDELADYAGKKEEVSAITERAMQGELEFEESLTERVACLKGISVSQMKECYADRITFTDGGNALISYMKQNNAYTALVSGGFTFFAQFVAKKIGFDTYRANELIAYDGKLTGKVKYPILGRASKKEALDEFIGFHRLSYDDVLAVGDGANDLDMLRAAGLGVAFHAKPSVAAQARVAINFSDLSALIYLQMEENNF